MPLQVFLKQIKMNEPPIYYCGICCGAIVGKHVLSVDANANQF